MRVPASWVHQARSCARADTRYSSKPYLGHEIHEEGNGIKEFILLCSEVDAK